MTKNVSYHINFLVSMSVSVWLTCVCGKRVGHISVISLILIIKTYLMEGRVIIIIIIVIIIIIIIININIVTVENVIQLMAFISLFFLPFRSLCLEIFSTLLVKIRFLAIKFVTLAVHPLRRAFKIMLTFETLCIK